MITLDEVIWFDPSSKLSFLRLFHTSEILASDVMKLFFKRLRES
jgi:hypothetical protein